MLKDIYDPLTEYINVFRDRFKSVAEETFAELAAEADVDVEANHETCRRIYAAEGKLSSVKTRVGWWTAWCVLLWLLVAGCIAAAAYFWQELEENVIIIAAGAVILVIVYLLARAHPRKKKLKMERDELCSSIRGLKEVAWSQMYPLNRLYDWDVLTRMITKTVPRLEFDPYFTMQRLADLKMSYDWDGSFNDERSVIYSHSGQINGNPFVICRTRKMEMGTKTYYGSKTISWTTQERDEHGRYYTAHHSETLRASVTAPYPEYYEATRLIYGNTAAPDLIFHREQSGLAGKEDSFSFKRKRRALRKKARNLKNGDFAMMTNEDFEVAFNTSDRNNNQQFALLFTPLAQESMLKLLQDNEAGYGDDFDFYKERMINTIYSNHMQELDLDLNPQRYYSFDYDRAKSDFYSINAEYFRAIYFCLAPLLCVPMYQQIRPASDIYGLDMKRHSAFWEHEALANFYGQNHFKHPECVTDCILKTNQAQVDGNRSVITVHAYGYRSVGRVTYIDKWGGDGRWHSVPVYWDEYLPVVGQGNIDMEEDNDFQDDSLSQRERMNHISSILASSKFDSYRRHIASKV